MVKKFHYSSPLNSGILGGKLWNLIGFAKEMAMSTRHFDEFDNEVEEFTDKEPTVPEANLSKKLERRRKIEDLFEEKYSVALEYLGR